jgi:hypothetical protein
MMSPWDDNIIRHGENPMHSFARCAFASQNAMFFRGPNGLSRGRFAHGRVPRRVDTRAPWREVLYVGNRLSLAERRHRSSAPSTFARNQCSRLITLTFSPLSSGSPVVIRGLFFRIDRECALRGPDSTVVATYTPHTWRLGARSFREFHCNNSIYLRVRNRADACEKLGPYEFVRAAEGGLFVQGQCIGTYSPQWETESGSTQSWQEITLLSAASEMA